VTQKTEQTESMGTADTRLVKRGKQNATKRQTSKKHDKKSLWGGKGGAHLAMHILTHMQRMGLVGKRGEEVLLKPSASRPNGPVMTEIRL